MSFEKIANLVKQEIGDSKYRIIHLDDGSLSSCQLSRKIDGLTYIINVRRSEATRPEHAISYALGFSTEEYGERITNKGLETYSKVVDVIVEMLTFLRETEKILANKK